MRNEVGALAVENQVSRLRLAAWLGGMVAIAALGFLRTATDAEYIFSSAAILPVVAVSWIGGRKDGFVLSLLAAIMWTSADILSQRQFTAEWIPFVNGLTHFVTNSLSPT